MVISATDATAISSKSFSDVTLNLIGTYDSSDDVLLFSTKSQDPSSPKIDGALVGPLDGEYAIGLEVSDKYQDCTIKLGTEGGLSENTHISYDSRDQLMIGKISNQMYTHLKEAGANSGRVTLMITVVS